jgi:glycosyltransferase involved in cell wall biosynthesis
MKIALHHNLGSGGSKREAYEFAKQFVKHGHTVHLYCPSNANERFLPLADVVQESFVFDLQFISKVSNRLPFLRRYVDVLTLLVNLRRLRQIDQRIAAQIDSGRYDWVFVHHERIVRAPYLLRYLKTPSTYYCAEVIREFYEPAIERAYDHPQSATERLQAGWYTPAERIRRAIIMHENRKNLRHATRLMTNSFFTVESIYRTHGLRARVVYLGVDSEKFRPLNLERQNFVISVGAVAPLKGFDFLIEALGCLPEKQRPRLLIVGNTASVREVTYLNALAAENKVALAFRVDVSEEELVALYNQARAFVYSPVLEPFGLASLEAMACATPVVAVKEGGVRESVRECETGCLVPRDITAFAAALQRVLEDRAFAEQLGANGRAQVLDFWTWDAAYERWMECLGDHAGCIAQSDSSKFSTEQETRFRDLELKAQ